MDELSLAEPESLSAATGRQASTALQKPANPPPKTTIRSTCSSAARRDPPAPQAGKRFGETYVSTGSRYGRSYSFRCFCCFCRKLSAARASPPAGMLGFGRRRNQKTAGLAAHPLSLAVKSSCGNAKSSYCYNCIYVAICQSVHAVNRFIPLISSNTCRALERWEE